MKPPPKFITIAWLAAHCDGGTDQERAASLLRSLHSDPDPAMVDAMARRLVERLADGAVPLTLLEDPVALLQRPRAEQRPRPAGIVPTVPDRTPRDAEPVARRTRSLHADDASGDDEHLGEPEHEPAHSDPAAIAAQRGPAPHEETDP